MVTLAERQAARKKKFKERFAAAGKKKASLLAGVAERTAQRRGRGFDPLETVIKQATKPPPPPKPKTRIEQARELVGCDPNARFGPTVSRGVSFICPGKAIQFNQQANPTTRRFFGSGISRNQKILRDAGFGDLIPPSPTEINNAKRAIKIARRKRNFNQVRNLEIRFCKDPRLASIVVGGRKCSSFKRAGLF